MVTSTDRAKRWRLANPERWKEHQRRYRYKFRKPCRVCGQTLPIRMGSKYHESCALIARKQQDKIRRSKTLQQVYAHKTAIGCSKCGYKSHGAALDWHHPNNNKERRITVKSYFTRLGENERSKCVLLCANCHRELHWRDVYA